MILEFLQLKFFTFSKIPILEFYSVLISEISKSYRYMHDHYGDQFEWFMRADDDVYVKTDKLSQFLRSINSNQLYFIGQAGRGSRSEKGTLNLAHDENFCMGGPGIILSRPALAKVVPHVHECLKDMYSTHEDVEVGRCVHRFAAISCTWAYEVSVFGSVVTGQVTIFLCDLKVYLNHLLSYQKSL